MLEKILELRGVDESFLYPTNPNHSATMFKNYDKASKLLVNHLNAGSKIFISYDVDIDGFVSGTIVLKFLEMLKDVYDISVKPMYHKRKDGHGIKYQFSQIDSDEGLVIIVDSSSNDSKDCKLLKDRGLDILAASTDHDPLGKGLSESVILRT